MRSSLENTGAEDISNQNGLTEEQNPNNKTVSELGAQGNAKQEVDDPKCIGYLLVITGILNQEIIVGRIGDPSHVAVQLMAP
jgi:hypothetical protein